MLGVELGVGAMHSLRKIIEMLNVQKLEKGGNNYEIEMLKKRESIES